MTKKKVMKKAAKKKQWPAKYPAPKPHGLVWVSQCSACGRPIIADLDKDVAKGSPCHFCENDKIPRLVRAYALYEGPIKMPIKLSNL